MFLLTSPFFPQNINKKIIPRTGIRTATGVVVKNMRVIIIIHTVWNICLDMLLQMLNEGCVAGFVSLDFKVLLSAMNAVMSLDIELSSSDPKVIIIRIA